MYRKMRGCLPALIILFSMGAAAEGGTLGDNQSIYSAHLGYALQYRVYTPVGVADDDQLPSLYVTDGQWYLERGNFKAVLDSLIASGAIEPVLVVFLDSRNPHDLSENRRNGEFMCSQKYASFFVSELVPVISTQQPVSLRREDRVILGLSFGGLNSACFGVMLTNVFAGIAMQSPAAAQHVDVVRELYEQRDTLPLKMFLSVGTRNDNYRAVNRFRKTLESKDYPLTFIKVSKGHDWDNWGPLIDDVLLTFFARENPSR